MACAKYGTGQRYGTGVRYCSTALARNLGATFYEALCQTLSIEVVHDGFFQLDTVKALAQDAQYTQFGFGVFPDLATVTYLSVEFRILGACRLDAIRPVVQILRKQLHG